MKTLHAGDGMELTAPDDFKGVVGIKTPHSRVQALEHESEMLRRLFVLMAASFTDAVEFASSLQGKNQPQA